jgi:hypothetical protein
MNATITDLGKCVFEYLLFVRGHNPLSCLRCEDNVRFRNLSAKFMRDGHDAALGDFWTFQKPSFDFGRVHSKAFDLHEVLEARLFHQSNVMPQKAFTLIR